MGLSPPPGPDPGSSADVGLRLTGPVGSSNSRLSGTVFPAEVSGGACAILFHC